MVSPPPDPPWIFHITAIPNLSRIAASGCLLSKSGLAAMAREHDNIAYENIQNRRSHTSVPVGPGGVLHDYVPFHFAPRQPMLSAIHHGRVPECRFGQADIVHLAARADRIAAAGLPFVLSTHHAVTMNAEFHDRLDRLDAIDWNMFFDRPLVGRFSKYFHNPSDRPEYATRRESRQAEFLVHSRVPIAQILGIGVINEEKRHEVQATLTSCGWAAKVHVRPSWYF